MMRSVNELQGYTVLATDGQIGKVDEFYFDDKEWIIRYLVVDTGGWFPGRSVLISPQALGQPNVKTRMLPLKLTRDQVENSPEVDTDKPVSGQYEVELHQHYGWPIYWSGPRATVSSADAGVHSGAGGKTNQDLPGDPYLRSTREVMGYHIQAHQQLSALEHTVEDRKAYDDAFWQLEHERQVLEAVLDDWRRWSRDTDVQHGKATD